MNVSFLPQRAVILSAPLLAILIAGCDTASVSAAAQDAAAGQQVEVRVSPTTTSVGPGGRVVFAAAVTGTADTGVAWTLSESSGAGTVSSSGLYTAPATAGTYHVVATSVADTTKSASATVTVTASPSTVSVAILPGSASVSGCQTATFTAAVTGSSNTGATWSVQEGATGGSITPAGVYTAPRAAGTYHVVATSLADGSRTAIVPVTVTTKVLSVALSPTSATVSAGGTSQLTATVTTTCGSFAAGT